MPIMTPGWNGPPPVAPEPAAVTLSNAPPEIVRQYASAKPLRRSPPPEAAPVDQGGDQAAAP